MTEIPNEFSEEYDWGGDGSDLHDPVAAHVRAALASTDAPYPAPIDQLLTLGDPREGGEDKLAGIAISQEHVPDLVRMARDRALNTAQSDSAEVWASVHALDALAKLDASAHVDELVPLFDVDTDIFGERLSAILVAIGAAALAPVRAYIQDPTRWIYGRANASDMLPKLVERHPDLRADVVQILTDALAQQGDENSDLNGMFLGDLLELKAVEALPVIRNAFEGNLIDETMAGDWETALKELGQPVDKHDPLVHRSRRRWDAKKAEMRAMLPPQWRPVPEQKPAAAPKPNTSATRKNKRKMAASSRKANKKKRR
jgi:hypothetical protein